MVIPKEKELKSISKKLTRTQGTLMLPNNPTPLEKFRWDICQMFLKYKIEHNLTQKELAERIGIDKAKMSKILRHRIDEFSTDRLIKLFFIVEPNLTLEVC
ncbi:XRE family transcriptional regulator [Halobacteriovorax marinus]|nr:XRE family transcriptional regulator [Halobacteriovorax marinus]